MTNKEFETWWADQNTGLGDAYKFTAWNAWLAATLHYDYARCAGTTHETCQWCRRREPGREQWQTYIAPAIDMMTGQCSNFIEPPKVYATSNTVPSAPESSGTL